MAWSLQTGLLQVEKVLTQGLEQQKVQLLGKQVSRYGLMILKLHSLRLEFEDGTKGTREGGLRGSVDDLTHSCQGFCNQASDDL